MPGWKVKATALLLGGVALALALPGAQAFAQASVATGVGTPFELAFWQSIDSSRDASLYEAYLTRYPNGTFSEIARAKIVTLRGRQAPPSAPTQVIAPAVAPALTVPVAATVPPPSPPPPPPPASPPPVAPEAVPTPVVAAPPPQTVASTSPAPVAPTSTMGQLLAALANSQTTSNPVAVQNQAAYQAPVAPRTLSPGFALPVQPELAPVASVALPPSFCSAEARNAFHATVYTPSVNAARQNNEAASAYMHQLQALYDQYQLSRDPDTMNGIVAAARNYQQVAQTTFSVQAALVRQFSALMAVPVVPCSEPAQPPGQTLVK